MWPIAQETIIQDKVVEVVGTKYDVETLRGACGIVDWSTPANT